MSGGPRPFAALVLGTAVFVLLLPLQVAGTVPWLLSRWRMRPPLVGWPGFRWLGAALILAGLPVLCESIVRFVRQGRGVAAAPHALGSAGAALTARSRGAARSRGPGSPRSQAAIVSTASTIRGPGRFR